VEVLFNNVGQVEFGEASVHASHIFVRIKDCPHWNERLPYRYEVVAFLGIVLKHFEICVVDATEPSALRITSVAQNAKDVRVDPVLLLIANVNGFVTVPPVHVSHLLKGNVAATSDRSLEVQLLAGGKVCEND